MVVLFAPGVLIRALFAKLSVTKAMNWHPMSTKVLFATSLQNGLD